MPISQLPTTLRQAAGISLALAAAGCAQLHAQAVVAPSSPKSDTPEYRRPALFLYSLGSANDNQRGLPKELGFTVGGTLELTRFFGIAEEASMLHWHGPLHTYTAVAGPRFTCQCGRLSPFAEVLGGLGHAGAWFIPVPPIKSYGLTGVAAAGITWRLTDHVSWIMQADGTHIYSQPGYRPLSGSTGLIVRVFDAR